MKVVPCVVVVPVTDVVSCDDGASLACAGGAAAGAEVLGGEGPAGLHVDPRETSEDRMPECDPEEEMPDPGSSAFEGVAGKRGAIGGRWKAGTHVQGHARFLQHLFRGYARLGPGAWGAPSGLSGCPMPRRPVTTFRCRGGMCLAQDGEYLAMQARAREVMDWQNVYVAIWRKLVKKAPSSYHPFAAGGADAYGVQRAGGIPHGTDIEHQVAFEQMFGVGSFEVSDAADRAAFLAHVARVNPVLISASPPCKKYSTSDMQKRSGAEDMIALTRDSCEQTGRL